MSEDNNRGQRLVEHIIGLGMGIEEAIDRGFKSGSPEEKAKAAFLACQVALAAAQLNLVPFRRSEDRKPGKKRTDLLDTLEVIAEQEDQPPLDRLLAMVQLLTTDKTTPD